MKKTGLTEQNLLERVQVLIVTLGKKGSVIKTRDEQIIDIPALRQDTMTDPTGAGDAYRAGLLMGLARQLPLQQSGQLAACAASYSIEKIGTQSHTFTMDEFRIRYKESFDEDCPV
jgi:adenosine kinase